MIDVQFFVRFALQTGQKPFRCPICDRRFSQSSSVTTHMRTHSGERPYRWVGSTSIIFFSSLLVTHIFFFYSQKKKSSLFHIFFTWHSLFGYSIIVNQIRNFSRFFYSIFFSFRTDVGLARKLSPTVRRWQSIFVYTVARNHTSANCVYYGN